MRFVRHRVDLVAFEGSFHLGCGRFCSRLPFQDALCPLMSQQVSARHEQIGQGARDEQPSGVLCDPAVSDVRESKHSLDHPNRMLDPDTDPRARICLPERGKRRQYSSWCKLRVSRPRGGHPVPQQVHRAPTLCNRDSCRRTDMNAQRADAFFYASVHLQRIAAARLI